MKLTDIRIRFLSSLVTNILRAGFSFLAGILIARLMGPAEYGNFTFLLGSFTVLMTLLDMSSSNAFYTFSSKDQRGRKFFGYYGAWLLIQLMALLLVVLCGPISLRAKLWLGQPLNLIVLALLASFAMRQIWGTVGQLGESLRDTIGVQLRNLALSVIYLLCVLALAYFRLMTIASLLMTNIVLHSLLSILYICRISGMGALSSAKPEQLNVVVREFGAYCLPLVFSSWAYVLGSFGDFWLLQRFGGPVQQGYYSIGERFAGISLIATSSMLQVFWKEIAAASFLGDWARVRLLYRRVSKALFFTGAVITCILIPFSQQILLVLLGAAYQHAWLPLSMMLLYPVHQSMGQITGTMFLALGRTRVAGYLGLLSAVSSVFFSYIVLAPRNALLPGLEMGAVGLAFKMVGLQMLTVNIAACLVARHLGAEFDWLHQINVLGVLLPVGFLSKLIAQKIPTFPLIESYPIMRIGVAIIIYLLCVVSWVRCYPRIAGVSKAQLERGLLWLRMRAFAT